MRQGSFQKGKPLTSRLARSYGRVWNSARQQMTSPVIGMRVDTTPRDMQVVFAALDPGA